MFSFTDQQIMMWTGEGILIGLILTLFARPLLKHFKIKWPMRYRKQLGWLTGGVASFHLGFWIVNYYKWPVLLAGLQSAWFLTGLGAMLVLLAMFLTSNKYSTKKLGGKRWKSIHNLVYFAVPMALFHTAYAIKGLNLEVFLWGIPLLSLVAWRLELTRQTIVLTSVFAAVFWIPQLSHQQTIVVVPEGQEEASLVNFNNNVIVNDLGELEFFCDKIIPESVSCGWPVYLEDGTRIDQ